MKKESPLMSIITVVLNGAGTIEQTIRSVIQQSYPNKEYIIIDGGSTDGTLDIIKKYGKNIDYWVSEPDKGIYDAMNKGIELARGELIGIINCDDWYENDIFSEIAEQYKKIGKEVVLHGMLRNHTDEFYSVKGNSTNVLKCDMIQHPTCFIPKSIYKEFGKYNTRYAYAADYDLMLRYVSAGVAFKFIERIIANFRIGGVSSTVKSDKEKYLVLVNHKIISRKEYFFRIMHINIAFFLKKWILN